ncbi:ParB/RepB/Spo0J family partition protein [Endozoicomonas montiporae]|uniref:ParB/RepB/Spo0J family partition protein n=1 Tax=Endozoicomonas montiporae TaxID=1027273 RepID=UPI000689C3E4|nr:ParB/RepB/Spo0J family partition protein [Endozoicomonas montiporae]
MGFLDKVNARKQAKKQNKVQTKENLNKLLLDDDLDDSLTPEVDIAFRAKATEEDRILAGERIIQLDPTRVTNKKQVRKKFDPEYISQLGQTMKKYGQYSPIIVSPANDDGVYVIQKGECRWRAAQEAGIQLDAVIRDAPESRSQEIIGELIENIQRYELECLELAESIHELRQEGLSVEEIAVEIGKTEKYVYRYAKLVDLPDDIRQLAVDGVVTDAQTLDELRKIYKVSQDRARALCATARTEGITRKQCARYLKEVKAQSRADSLPPSTASKTPGNKTNNEPAPGTSDQPSVNEPLVRHERHFQRHDDYAFMDLADDRRLRIAVRVEENNIEGFLCLSRVDEDENYLWIEVEGGKIRAHRNDIRLLGATDG